MTDGSILYGIKQSELIFIMKKLFLVSILLLPVSTQAFSLSQFFSQLFSRTQLAAIPATSGIPSDSDASEQYPTGQDPTQTGICTDKTGQQFTDQCGLQAGWTDKARKYYLVNGACGQVNIDCAARGQACLAGKCVDKPTVSAPTNPTQPTTVTRPPVEPKTGQPKITFIFPKGGESLPNGATGTNIANIRWTTENFTDRYVKISLIGATHNLVLKTVAPILNNGSYVWHADPTIYPGRYKFRITSQASSTIMAETRVFSIGAGTSTATSIGARTISRSASNVPSNTNSGWSPEFILRAGERIVINRTDINPWTEGMCLGLYARINGANPVWLFKNSAGVEQCLTGCGFSDCPNGASVNLQVWGGGPLGADATIRLLVADRESLGGNDVRYLPYYPPQSSQSATSWYLAFSNSFSSVGYNFVVTPAIRVDGACGTAHGFATATMPPTAGKTLCRAGTVSSVAPTNPWTWSCYGSKGGTTATCSAPKTSTFTNLPRYSPEFEFGLFDSLFIKSITLERVSFDRIGLKARLTDRDSYIWSGYTPSESGLYSENFNAENSPFRFVSSNNDYKMKFWAESVLGMRVDPSGRIDGAGFLEDDQLKLGYSAAESTGLNKVVFLARDTTNPAEPKGQKLTVGFKKGSAFDHLKISCAASINPNNLGSVIWTASHEYNFNDEVRLPLWNMIFTWKDGKVGKQESTRHDTTGVVKNSVTMTLALDDGRTIRKTADCDILVSQCIQPGGNGENERPDVRGRYNLRSVRPYTDIFNDLTANLITDINAKDLSSWLKNDIWDISGGEEQVKSYMAQRQLFGSCSTMNDFNVAPTANNIENIKANYFDRGHMVKGAIIVAGAGLGHAVIFTGVKITKPRNADIKYDFSVWDSNYPSGITKFTQCASAENDASVLICQKSKYGVIHIRGFITKLTDDLIEEKSASCPRTGDLCASKPLERLKKLISSIGSSLANFNIPESPGVCAGWSDALVKMMYLANFVGENNLVASEPACLSAVAGKDKTFVCTENRSACEVEWSATFTGMSGHEKTYGSKFAICAYHNKPTSLPGGLNLLKMLGVNEVKCDGLQYTKVTGIGELNSLFYKATDKSKAPLKP